ncbi:MAG: DinB family protein [Aureispira sp.]
MQEQLSLNRDIRRILGKELETLSLAQLNYIPSTHNNNIFWNIAHCVAVQQALCYSLSGLATPVEANFVKNYRRGTQPEQPVNQAMVDRLQEVLGASIDWFHRDWTAGLFKEYKPYTTASGTHLTNVEEAVAFNNLHESIHYGYILALKKLL